MTKSPTLMQFDWFIVPNKNSLFRMGHQQNYQALNGDFRALYGKLRADDVRVVVAPPYYHHHLHLCLNEPLWAITDHDAIVQHIRNFKVHGFDVTENHKYVFPTQIAATRWKYDYIIFRKK